MFFYSLVRGNMIKTIIPPIALMASIWCGTSLANSSDLAKSMMASEAALLGMKLSLEKGVNQGNTPKEHFECVDKIDRHYFLKNYSDILKEYLSSDEIKQALNFYTSEAGRKYTHAGIIQLRMNLIPGEKWPIPDFKEEEQNLIEGFGKTSAGQKLWKERLLSSKKIVARINPLLKDLYDKCKP